MIERHARHDEAVHAVYAAALEPTRWPEAMRCIAATVGAPRGMMFTMAHTPDEGGFRMTLGLEAPALAVWDATHFRNDPSLVAAARRELLFEGSVICCDDILSPVALRGSDYYRDVWNPLGIDDFCAGVVFGSSDARTLPTSLSVFRGPGHARFGDAERALLGSFVPHVSRALGVMFHLRDQERRLAATTGALERLSAGVLLLDARRRVAFHNAAARRAMQGDPLRLIADPAGDRIGLPARLQAFDGPLQATIEQALAPSLGPVDHFSQALVLPGADGAPASVLHVASLDPDAVFGSREHAVVIVYDLTVAGRVPPARLVEQFGLTAAEARAALQVLQAGTAEDMAGRLGVSVNTFKTQLGAAYAKTATHRQSALLKLLLALAEP